MLLGENSAGKSTMMKVIAGAERLTSGTIALDGKPVQFRAKADAVRAGIGIVFQELNLFPNLTIAKNTFIARERTRFGIDIDSAARVPETRALMARPEQDIDAETPVGNPRTWNVSLWSGPRSGDFRGLVGFSIPWQEFRKA